MWMPRKPTGLLLQLCCCYSVPMLVVHAQEACYTSSDIAGSVLGTFFSTLATIAVGILVYWFFCRKRRAKAAVTRPTDEEIERHAYTNPYFQDDELDSKVPAEENGKPGIDNGSTKLTIVSDKKAPKGNKKTKANSRNNPFSVFGNNKGHPPRAMDDSCIHQEPERIEVNLRGSDFTGLGFNICGNIRDGIYVRDVLHRGPAGESGKIKAGDRIMNVTVSFDKITIEDALTILSYASPYDVSLDVQKTSDHPGCFLPGHQKKGSMDSSTSGSMGSGGERLSHPIYRSQSSDDVSHLSREGGSNSKRSLGVAMQANRLKKESSTSKQKTDSLQEEPSAEGSANPSVKSSRFKVDKLNSVEGEVQVVVHKEQPNLDNGQSVAISQVKPTEGKKKEEVLAKKQATKVEPMKKLTDEIDGVFKDMFNSGEQEAAKLKPEQLKPEQGEKSTNPFDVSIEASKDATNDDLNENRSNHFSEIGNMQSLSSMLDNFMKDVKESIETDTQEASNALKSEASKLGPGVMMTTVRKTENDKVVHDAGSKPDVQTDNLSDFDITIPSLDLDDLQETFQATMNEVNAASAAAAKRVADTNKNASEAAQNASSSLQKSWTTSKQNAVDAVANEASAIGSNVQTSVSKLREDSQDRINSEVNGVANAVLSGLNMASGSSDKSSLEIDSITPDSLEIPSVQSHQAQSSVSKETATASGIEVQGNASSKASAPQPILDLDLNENIQYFENKMQAALQKSPKVKSKRSAVPGKRKAPQPPTSPQNQPSSPNGEDESSSKLGNPFVVGLHSMGYPLDGIKDENVVLIKSNNVTTVKVNVDNSANNNGEIKDQNLVEDEKKASSPRKISSKTDGNFSFGFLKTNFFEGLDKAGNEDAADSKGDMNRFNSIPRSCTTMQGPISSESSKDRRSSSLGDLTKIKETNSKSPVLERAVSMDLKEVDQVPGGQLGEIKMDVDGDNSSAKDSSDEVSLSRADVENGTMAHSNEADENDLEVVSNHKDLEEWIDEKVADKQNHKKYKLIQGLFKKEKGTKPKKRDEVNEVAEITLPVSNTMIISTATINVNSDQKNHDEIIEKSLTLSPEIESEQEVFPNCKVQIGTKEELHRQTSLSSSSLSEDSIDEERRLETPPKRRMIAVESNETYDYEYDSSDDETISPQSPTPTGSNHSGNLHNEHHEPLKSHLSIPIIPPIILSKDLRSPTLANDDASHHGELSRPVGQVRSLSPTKLLRSEVAEENGNSQAGNADGVATNHYSYSHQSSNSVTNDSNNTTAVTTMHVTVTNNVTPQFKNSVELSESFAAFPIASQGAISKTLIISSPQLTLPLETATSGGGSDPESPLPNLEPPQ